MRIAIDGMGGDRAPRAIVEGCVGAVNELDIEIILVGKEEILQAELNQYQFNKSKIHIKNAEEVITNEDKPVQAIKRKKDSSLVVGLNLVKEGEADAFVSAGNTGALLAGGIFRLGRIKGIDRPAIGSVYPTRKGISILIDAGANAECKPRNMVEFAIMGTVYAEKVLGKIKPTVGLVNIGTEEEKGTDFTRQSFERLRKSSVNFYGNAEARDIPVGIVDVIVCDGFVGNIILKLSEGVAMNIMSMLKEQLMKNIFTKMASALLKSSFRALKKSMDYTEYGGAPLLGLNGVVIKAHGSSNAKAIKNAIIQAKNAVEKDIIHIIGNEIEKMGDEDDAEQS